MAGGAGVGRARRGARAGARTRRRRSGSARDVGDPAPRGLGRQLDGLAVAVRLDVHEGAGLDVELDVELALLDALVEPGGAEDEAAQPVHERAVRRADQLGPAVVDVLAEAGGRLLDLAVDGERHEVLELGVVQAAGDEPQLVGGLLAALAEVALVEGEPEFAVFEDEVLSAVVVASACVVHGGHAWFSRAEVDGGSRSRRHRMPDPFGSAGHGMDLAVRPPDLPSVVPVPGDSRSDRSSLVGGEFLRPRP